MNEAETLRLALLGAPNCGKSSLFNALTGGRAKVANYPGVTVEYRKGELTLPSGQAVELLDLPGVYGDCGHSMDERVALDAVRGDLEGERAPDAILFMMDASHITTHLHNVLQAKNHDLPIILVLNMMDMAARDGITIDLPALERELGIPVVSCVAVRASGRSLLLDYLEEWGGDVSFGSAVKPDKEIGALKDLQVKARSITRTAVSRVQQTETFSQRIDNWVLHPVMGIVILFLILFFMFQAVYMDDITCGRWNYCGCWGCADFPSANYYSLCLYSPFRGLRVHGTGGFFGRHINVKSRPERPRLHSVIVKFRLRDSGRYGGADH